MTDNLMSKPGILFAIDISSPTDRVQAFIDSYKQDTNDASTPETFDTALLSTYMTLLSATVTSPTHAIVTFSVNIDPGLCSRAGRLHGAAAALIFDMCTTMAVAPIARADFWHFGGFSRTLSVTYFRPAEVGSVVVVECEVVQIGKALATIHGKIKRKSDGVILCFAEHNKASVDLTVQRGKAKI